MGQKVNPNCLRLGINRNWQSRWIAKDNKQTAQWLLEDHQVRSLIFKVCKVAVVSSVEIERQEGKIDVIIHCSQPGVIFGKENANLNVLRKQISYIVGKKTHVRINVLVNEKSLLNARVVAREVADAIENRFSFRNAQKLAIKKVLAAGAKGIKTNVSGRLGGVEMAREMGYSEGSIPLSTLRADIDYAFEEAHTTYGKIGVKIWINRGELFREKKPAANAKLQQQQVAQQAAKAAAAQLAHQQKLAAAQAEAQAKAAAAKVEVDPETLKREQEVLKVVEKKQDDQKAEETSIIMISAKTRYTNILFDKTQDKYVLFYKTAPANPVERVLVYATEEARKVVGEFDLDKIEHLSTNYAWTKWHKHVCLTKAEYDSYASENEKVYVYIFKKGFLYSKPKSLSEYNMEKGPSGFQYLR